MDKQFFLWITLHRLVKAKQNKTQKPGRLQAQEDVCLCLRLEAIWRWNPLFFGGPQRFTLSHPTARSRAPPFWSTLCFAEGWRRMKAGTREMVTDQAALVRRLRAGSLPAWDVSAVSEGQAGVWAGERERLRAREEQ